MSGIRTAPNKGRRRALVVEPDRRQADVAAATLRECGYVASVVSSPRDALMVLAKPPKLVLLHACGPLDPAVEFLQAFQRVKALREVPVFGTHGSAPPSDYARSELRKHGLVGFLPLPIDPDLLGDLLSGAPQDSLPPLLTHASEARPRMISPQEAARTSRVGHRATDPTVAAVAIGGIAGAITFGGTEAQCVVTAAESTHVLLRSDGPFPNRDVEVRVFLSFRDVVRDSMKDLPVRILGRVTDIEPRGTTRRMRVQVRVASPTDHLTRLSRYLSKLP
jgi:CheY-like chemotaxis protein